MGQVMVMAMGEVVFVFWVAYQDIGRISSTIGMI